MLTIDSDFQSLIPALTSEEFAGLEQNILTHGCRVPLDVWGDVLIDGHNRYAICQKHGLPFETKAIQLANRYEAFNWIINNQLGRRNVTEEQKSYLRGKRYEAEKKSMAEAGAMKKESFDHFDQSSRITHEKLSQEFGVSSPTIRRDEKFAKGIDLISAVAPEEKAVILSGKSEITKQEVQRLAAIPGQIRKDIAQTAILQTDGHITQEVNRLTDERVKQELAKLAERNNPHVANNSGENEWYTPQEFIDAAYQVLGRIDLDPASSEIANKTVRALRIFSLADNGLLQKWEGNVWMNPPYEAGLIDKFCQRYKQSVENGDVKQGIVLVNNATETKWFRTLVNCSSAIVFPERRIRFVSPSGKLGAPLQGQAIFYAGENRHDFLATFSVFGWGAIL